MENEPVVCAVGKAKTPLLETIKPGAGERAAGQNASIAHSQDGFNPQNPPPWTSEHGQEELLSTVLGIAPEH